MQTCWFCIFLQFLCIFFAHCGPKIFLKLETGFEVTGYSIGTKYGRPNWHKYLAPTVATGSELLWLWSNLSDKKCCRMLLLGDVESSFKLLICGIITWNWTGLNVALEAGLQTCKPFIALLFQPAIWIPKIWLNGDRAHLFDLPKLISDPKNHLGNPSGTTFSGLTRIWPLPPCRWKWCAIQNDL